MVYEGGGKYIMRSVPVPLEGFEVLTWDTALQSIPALWSSTGLSLNNRHVPSLPTT